MSNKHRLNDKDCYRIVHNSKKIERNSVIKILGINVDEHLDWREHVNHVIKSVYSTFRTLKQFKRFSTQRLAESLVLSKLLLLLLLLFIIIIYIYPG